MKTSHLLGLLTFGATAISAILIPTGVTPGSYTSADLTVDAYGRIISASNGSGGGGGGDVYTSSNNIFTGDNTFEGNTAFSSLDIGTLIATNAYFTTQSQGDNSTNAATTAYVDTAVASVGGGGFDPFTIANTLAYGYYEFVGNTVASAVIPWNSAAISSGSTIQFTPTAAYPDPGQIAFRAASGTATNTGGIITAAADTLYFTNNWAFACSLFTTKTNGSMWRIGINSSQNSTVPTDQFSFTVTNNQCYPTAFSNTIVTLGTPYTLEINTQYTLKARATNQGGAHYEVWSNGALVSSNDIVSGLPWQRNIAMGVLGLNASTENTNSTAFLRVGMFAWTNSVTR